MAKIETLKRSAVATIKRVSASLALIAEAVDEITEVGENDLDGKAAYGFSNIVRSCAEDLQKLTPPAGLAKTARGEV